MSLAHNVPLLELFRQDRRALELERRASFQSPSAAAQLDSSRDQYSAIGPHRVQLGREPFIVFGRIIDAVGYAHFYKVQLGREGGIISACASTHTSLELIGAKQLNTYTPGAAVIVLWAPHLPFGIILGSYPDFMISPLDALGDRVVQGSHVGLKIDPYHNFPFNLPLGGGVIDWSAGRANDQIHPGEWGVVTETGLMVFADPRMFMMRVDEETGVFGFYADQMLRVAGHNLELRSSGYERTDDDDEWEFNLIEECVPGYLWEGRGAFDRDTAISRDVSNEDAQLKTPWYAETEPADDHQQPIRRYRKFMGYLGQGYKRTLFILPEGKTGLMKMDDQIKFPGVAEEQWGLDGFISQRSAKGIILSKRCMIPSPKMVKMPENTEGDTAENYRQDGVHGSEDAPEHLVSDIDRPPCTPTNLLQAAAFPDLYAHVFNWRGLHPFHYHEKDWYMPQETDYSFAEDMKRGNPPFVDLKGPGGAYMLAPNPLQFTVDERYGKVMYFPNNSYIALLDDGGIVIGDGYGAETRMTGGNIYNTAPNDIYDLAGKNVVALAGRDWIARANWGAQLVANKCNVHIKADNKVEILGGNNEKCGGVLIESKAPTTNFLTNTPTTTPLCSIHQSGGFRNAITATVDCGSFQPPKLKEVYTICVTKGGQPGVARINVTSFSGTDDVDTGMPAAENTPTSIGLKGVRVTFINTQGGFVVGQQWTVFISKDPNDINDEVIGGVVIRAKRSTVFTYAKDIENLLSDDGKDGLMIFDAGRQGVMMQHSNHNIRHVEGHADDIYWDTDPPELVILAESTGATKDETRYFGPDCTYTITCLSGNYDQPLNAARVSVTSSLADDSSPSLVVGAGGKLTAVGNRGFLWAPSVPTISMGDTWSYLLKQKTSPCVNHYSCDQAVLAMPHYLKGALVVDGCVSAVGRITATDVLAGSSVQVIAPQDDQMIKGEATSAQKVRDDHNNWANTARRDLTVIKDSTEVTKMEFGFPSSYQLGTEAPWKLFEIRWQQMDRNQDNVGVAWTESEVTGDEGAAFVSVTSLPWPGKYAWKEYSNYYIEDVDLFKLDTNLLEDRGEPYETPVAYKPPQTNVLDGEWRIIENPCEG